MSTPTSRSGLWMLLAGLAILVGLYAGWRVLNPRKAEPDMVKVMELNNRGVVHMDRFEFKSAVEVFDQISRTAPDWLPGRINLGIALLNQAGEGSDTKPAIDRAVQEFQFVLSREPNNPHAHFCLGFIRLYYQQFIEAIPHFEAVLRIDPNDAGAWYHLGFLLTQKGDEPDRAKECFENAHRLHPYMSGPINNLISMVDDAKRSQELARLDKQLRAATLLKENTQKYTEQGGRYSQVIGRPEKASPTGEPSRLPVCAPYDKFRVKLAPETRWAKAEDFEPGPVGEVRRLVRKRFGATVIALDYNRDNRPDLFLIGAVVEKGKARDLLLRNDGDGSFTDVTREAGLAGAQPSLGCCSADFDNDNLPDLFISGAGVQKLYRNKGDGTFEDVSSKAGLDRITDVCLGCAWIDLDQDGDLDLLVARYAETPQAAVDTLKGGRGKGGVAVLLNIGEAFPVPGGQYFGGLSVKFTRAPELEATLSGNDAAVAIAVTDADQDVDLDAIVLNERSPVSLVVNDRLLRFRRGGLDAVPSGQAWNGCLVTDVDQDERSDLLLLASGEVPTLLMNRAEAGTPATKLYEKGVLNSPPLIQACVVDHDLDGWPDVVGLTSQGKPVLLHNDRLGRLVAVPEALGADRDLPPDLIAVLPVDVDGDGNPDVLLWSEGQGLQARRSQGTENQSVKVRLIGRRENANPPIERCNNDSIGARITIQTGRHHTTLERATLCAGLGQSAEPLLLGLGRASLSDAIVRIRWPHQSIQGEFLNAPKSEFCSLEKENVWVIREKNRKGTSCPILITWNGEKWVYITDFLGEGSVGEMQAGGGTRPARPEESVKIESHQLRPKNGMFMMRIAEPLDEVTYLDRLRLDVIDLPPGVNVFPDERFATSDPPPTQQRLFFRDRFFARKAVDQRERDVTTLLRERDRKMVGGFDYRSWIGFAGEHWVELDFGDQLAKVAKSDRLFLVVAGWTDYAYPESIFAAKQAGIELVAPVLEGQGTDGRWQPICDIGFPAGLPRVMARDVTGLLAGHSGKLRIRTNMQIYWDQVFLAPAVDVREARVAELAVAKADLGFRGFLREIRPDDSPLIEYDPERVVPVPVTRWKGFLTRLGDVSELLAATDDRSVIIGPGDEMSVRFDARGLPPLPTGSSRQFVLRTWGWCKDASQFTATGGEVGPLPFRAMKQYPPGPEERYPHPDDLRTWHTRRPR